jgi:hypothetical protein
MKRVKWIFNPLMIWGAVLGFIIFNALGTIQDTWNHRGAAYVSYEQPDRTVKVAERQYKRNNYAAGVMMLSLGLIMWVVVARGARDEAAKTSRPANDRNV